jgi:hypothetical protein
MEGAIPLNIIFFRTKYSFQTHLKSQPHIPSCHLSAGYAFHVYCCSTGLPGPDRVTEILSIDMS